MSLPAVEPGSPQHVHDEVGSSNQIQTASIAECRAARRYLDPGRMQDDCVEVEWLLREGLPAELPEREGLKVYKV